jgi:uncharacterized protein (DUF488 family)
MFYRRKVILALLQAFDGTLPKTSLQKLLFLFVTRQAKPEYDFVPYLYGCFSFSANADITAMVKHGQLSEDKVGFTKIDPTDYAKLLSEADRKTLIEIKQLYGRSSATSLMKMTYLNHPYYAINSVKAMELLTEDQYQRVIDARPANRETILYTIGYEGISLEEYLNRLVKNDVKVLVDVRNNAQSMKFGFSKTQLKSCCASLYIEYVHIPEVGIQSEQRQELKTQSDYDTLFEAYRRNNLPNTVSQQEAILSLLRTKKRIALTCFEADICQCHRKHLAEAIIELAGREFALKHI